LFQAFKDKPEFFPLFFRRVLELCLVPDTSSASDGPQSFSAVEKCQLLIFLGHCVTSLVSEFFRIIFLCTLICRDSTMNLRDIIREQVQKIFGLPIWLSLSARRLEIELKKVPNLKKPWEKLLKKDHQKDEASKKEEDFYRNFMRNLMQSFEDILISVTPDGNSLQKCVYFTETCFLNILLIFS
jgi:hypothetical protein